MASRKVQTNVKNPKRVEEQRSKIVKAAIRLVIEKGFHETSVREIGQAAGLTQGTLYNYIRSKGDILYLICDEVVTAYLGAVEKGIDRAPAGVSRTEAAIRALIEEMYQQQDLILAARRYRSGGVACDFPRRSGDARSGLPACRGGLGRNSGKNPGRGCTGLRRQYRFRPAGKRAHSA